MWSTRADMVGKNADHPRCEMNQDIRARIAQQAANVVALHRVVVGAAGHEHVLCSVLAQFVDDEGTEGYHGRRAGA